MKLTKAVHHIALKCKGMEQFEKTIHFYRDLLGMEVVRSWGEAPDCGIMLDIGGGSVMEIFSNAGEELGQGTIRHFALATDDVDACVAAVRAEGYAITVEPKDVNVGGVLPARIAFCIGPVGEEVEFFCEK